MRGIALVLASLVMLVSVAAAAPNAEPAQPAGAKDSGTAIGLSVGFEVGSFVGMMAAAPFEDRDVKQRIAAAGFAGMVVSPTLGHWYAGAIVTPGLVARVVAVGTGAY